MNDYKIFSRLESMGVNESQFKNLKDSPITKIDDHYGGPIKYYSYTSKAVQVISLDKQYSQKFIKLLESRKKFSHPNLITSNNHHTYQYRQGCGFQQVCQFAVEYDYVNRTLEDEISKYCAQRMPIPQKQIRRIFREVVSCLQYLKNNGTCHGDVKPSNIMIDLNGKVQLIDSYFVNGGKTSYQIVMENPSSMSLLSPQQLTLLKNRMFGTLQNIHVSQVWSVGLSMLQAMTAQPAMECYNLNNLKVKQGYFDPKLRQLLMNGYSNELSALVLRCVALDPNLRPSYEQFLDLINGNQGYNVHPYQNVSSYNGRMYSENGHNFSPKNGQSRLISPPLRQF